MAYEKGRQQALAIALESTRLTKNVTVATYRYIPYEKFDIGNKNTYKDAGYSMFSRSSQTNRIFLNKHAEGNISTILDADILPYFLNYCFGSSTPVTALSATTWAFAVNQNLATPTFTLNYETPDEGFKSANGGLPSKLNIDIGLDDATISMDFTAIEETIGTSMPPVAPFLSKTLQGHDTVVRYAPTKAGAGAGTIIKDVKSVKIVLETGNDIEKNKVLGSRVPNNNLVNGIKCEIELEVLSEISQAATIQALYDASDNGSKRALSIDLTDTLALNIGTSALKPRFNFEIPPSIFEVQRIYELDELVMQKIKIVVENADLITAIVQCATAAI